MDLTEVGRDGVDWMHMAQDRDQWMALVNTVMRDPPVMDHVATRNLIKCFFKNSYLQQNK
jgi:hypothetical protein